MIRKRVNEERRLPLSNMSREDLLLAYVDSIGDSDNLISQRLLARSPPACRSLSLNKKYQLLCWGRDYELVRCCFGYFHDKARGEMDIRFYTWIHIT